MPVSFDQCAVEYAEAWFGKEAAIVADLRSPDKPRRLAALQKGAGYFKVARTMPTAHDVGQGRPRLAPALAVLDTPQFRTVTSDGLTATIRTLRQRLAVAYGKKDLLSAATKFLWLLHPDVAIIFDSQARDALGSPYGDYDEYVDRWRARYRASVGEIRRACASRRTAELASRRLVGVPESKVAAVAGKRWFQMRVFDVRLWHEGAPRS